MVESLEREIEGLRSLFRSEMDPEGRAFVPLADAYRRSHDIQKALEVLNEGLGRHPGLASAHVVAAWIHQDRGDRETARAAWKRVLELDEENVEALRGLANLLLQSGRREEARPYMMRARALEPDSPEPPAWSEAVATDASAVDATPADASAADAPPADVPAAEVPAPLPEDSAFEIRIEPVDVPADVRPTSAEGGEPAPVSPESTGAGMPESEAAGAGTASFDLPLLEPVGSESGHRDAAIPEPAADSGSTASDVAIPELEASEAASWDLAVPELAASEAPPTDLGTSELAVPEAVAPEPLPLLEPAARETDADEAAAHEPSVETPAEEPLAAAAGAEALLGSSDASDDVWEGRSDEEGAAALPSTRTMAELYARQGLFARAVEVYDRLIEEDPSNQSLRARRDELRAPRTPPAPPPPPVHEADTEAIAGVVWGPVEDEPPSPFGWHPEASEAHAEPAQGSREPVSSYFRSLLAWVPGSGVPAEPERSSEGTGAASAALPTEAAADPAVDTAVTPIELLAPDALVGPESGGLAPESAELPGVVPIATLAPDAVPIESLAPDGGSGHDPSPWS